MLKPSPASTAVDLDFFFFLLFECLWPVPSSAIDKIVGYQSTACTNSLDTCPRWLFFNLEYTLVVENNNTKVKFIVQNQIILTMNWKLSESLSTLQGYTCHQSNKNSFSDLDSSLHIHVFSWRIEKCLSQGWCAILFFAQYTVSEHLPYCSCNSMSQHTVFEVSDQIFLIFEGFPDIFGQF